MTQAALTARLAELDRMIYGDGTTEAMEVGDRRDALEATYDGLLDQLAALEVSAPMDMLNTGSTNDEPGPEYAAVLDLMVTTGV